MENTTRKNNLDGKVAVVTGATSGIGRAAAIALASEGAKVVAAGRNTEKLRALAVELEKISGAGNYRTIECDATKETDAASMASSALSAFGRIDCLVACAGIGKSVHSKSMFPVETARLPLSEWEDVLNVNLTGVFLSNRAVLPAMTAQKSGTIVNISSYPAGVKGQPFAPAYSASKFAVIGFSESLADEVRAHGIKVHVLLPGLTDTPMTSGTALGSKFGKALRPESVADLIVYLLALPADTSLGNTVLAPFRARKRKGEQQ